MIHPVKRSSRAMKIVKEVCTVVPVLLLTAGAVLGLATVMSLSSWALL